jgi:flagellar biosynthetic protein FliR
VDVLGITQARFFSFVLILLRTGSLFAFAPVFSSPLIPAQVKAASVLGLSLALAALGVVGGVEPPATMGLLVLVLAKEVILGLITGFVARLVFVAVEFGGQLVGFDMGLGIVSVFDPQSEARISVISQLQFLVAMLLFLAVGGDRMLVEVFAAQLREIPPGQVAFTGPVLRVLIELSAGIFVAALRVAAPVIAALFAANVILGVFARSVPQMNMLILGFPLKIVVGFAVLGLSLSYWSDVILRALSDTFEALRALPSLLG